MPIRSRRVAREWILKILYEIDIAKKNPLEAVADEIEDEPLDKDTADFVKQLVEGVSQHREELDKRIASLSHEWALDRQPVVDRNILRMCSYEILYCPGVPPAAAINEAVELAKKYSTAESGRFVNGVLGALLDSLAPEEKAHL